MIKELDIMKDCRNLVKSVYELTDRLPKEQKFSLCNQMQRCSISIGSNIVEGQNRNSTKEYLRFLYVSRGSYYELKFQNDVCKDIYNQSVDELVLERVGKRLNSLINAIKRLSDNSSKSQSLESRS